jgi:hypothetical protein
LGPSIAQVHNARDPDGFEAVAATAVNCGWLVRLEGNPDIGVDGSRGAHDGPS